LVEGERLVLDGQLGVVYANPDDAILHHYERVRRDSEQYRLSLESVRNLPANSLDGQPVSLQANGERTADLKAAIAANADGVGLFRPEFLYLEGDAPDEESQLNHYLEALEALEGRTLTIRTLDLGADKPTGSTHYSSQHSASNPALGLRAVRLCLRDTDLFRIQLQAILRASAEGPVRCLIPMLTSVHEISLVRSLLEESRQNLEKRQLPFDDTMPMGGMIEVPAAAFALEELGAHLDFLSVGTNDLLQYALAVDRVDEQVAHLYDPQHPGVVRLLGHIFKVANQLGKEVAVCGELAGDSRYTRLLLALGLRKLSMHPGNLLEVKQVIRDTDISRATAALTGWLNNAQSDREEESVEPSLRSGRISLLQAIDQSQ
jgi:phosphotransferase system enzyme I (PtsI)